MHQSRMTHLQMESTESRVEASHVRAHKGHLLNEVADHFAKQGRCLTHYRKVYRTLDSRRAAIPQHSNDPPFRSVAVICWVAAQCISRRC